MNRNDLILMLEDPTTGKMQYLTSGGWRPCTPMQTEHAKQCQRIEPTFVPHDESRTLRGIEVSIGLAAFGKPFWIRKAEVSGVHIPA